MSSHFPLDVELQALKEQNENGLISDEELATKTSILIEKSLKNKNSNDSESDNENKIDEEKDSKKDEKEMNSIEKTFVGIDFGSTHVTVAVANEQFKFPHIVRNDMGNYSTPALVSFTGKRRLIGEAAKSYVLRDAKNTVVAMRDVIGVKFENVDKDFILTTHQEQDGELVFKVNYDNNDLIQSPANCVVALLNHIRRLIARFVSVDETSFKPNAVLAVPLKYTAKQQQSLSTAVIAAGFQLDRVVSDALALSYCYAITHGVNGARNVKQGDSDDKQDDNDVKEKENKANVLFVDAGANTTSLAIASIQKNENSFEIAIEESHCIDVGGNNFTQVLVDKALEKSGFKDLKEKQRARLWREAERAKNVLSTVANATIALECFQNDKDLKVVVTRDDLLDGKSKECLKQLTEKSNSLTKPFCAVELVGGTSRVPSIRENIALTTNSELEKGGRTLDSAGSVALGAAGIGIMSELSPLSTIKDDVKFDSFDIKSINQDTIQQLINNEDKLYENDVIVVKVQAAENNLEQSILTIKERFDSSIYKDSLKDAKTELTELFQKEQDWLYEQDDDGNESNEVLKKYEDRLKQVNETIAKLAPKYIEKVEEESKKALEARLEAEKAAKEKLESLSTDVNKPRSNKQRITAAEKQKQGGNVAIKDLDYKSAVKHYVDALSILSGAFDMTPEQEEQIKKLRLGCYLNAAMCYLKLKLWKKTADNATYALELDPTNTKGLFRRATAFAHLGEIDKSMADLEKCPEEDKAVQALKKAVNARIEKRKANEKKIYGRMFA